MSDAAAARLLLIRHGETAWNAEHRILVTGDALWERGFGFVMPRAIDPLFHLYTERIAQPDVRFCVARGEAVPLASEVMDAVFCFNVLDHGVIFGDDHRA